MKHLVPKDLLSPPLYLVTIFLLSPCLLACPRIQSTASVSQGNCGVLPKTHVTPTEPSMCFHATLWHTGLRFISSYLPRNLSLWGLWRVSGLGLNRDTGADCLWRFIRWFINSMDIHTTAARRGLWELKPMWQSEGPFLKSRRKGDSCMSSDRVWLLGSRGEGILGWEPVTLRRRAVS